MDYKGIPFVGNVLIKKGLRVVSVGKNLRIINDYARKHPIVEMTASYEASGARLHYTFYDGAESQIYFASRTIALMHMFRKKCGIPEIIVTDVYHVSLIFTEEILDKLAHDYCTSILTTYGGY